MAGKKETDKQETHHSIVPAFNTLSLPCRWSLYGASLAKNFSHFAKSDIKNNPIRYPLYALGVGSLAFGFGGLWLITAVASLPLIAYSRYGTSPWAKGVRNSYRKSFNHSSFTKFYSKNPNYFKPFSNNPRKIRVKKYHLLKDTLKACWHDITSSSHHFKAYLFNDNKKLPKP